MGTNVNAMRMEDFTDASWTFYIGMTEDDAAKLKDSLFKEFCEINDNDNGNDIIEPDELWRKIRRDAAEKRDKSLRDFWRFTGIGAYLLIGTYPRSCSRVLLYPVGMFFGIRSLILNIKSRKLSENARALKNLIDQQEKETSCSQEEKIEETSEIKEKDIHSVQTDVECDTLTETAVPQYEIEPVEQKEGTVTSKRISIEA